LCRPSQKIHFLILLSGLPAIPGQGLQKTE